MMKIKFIPQVELAKDFPPVPARSVIPSWYKDLPNLICEDNAENRIRNNPPIFMTIKKCVPVQDYCLSGYSFRLFSDVQIYQNNPMGINQQVAFLPRNDFYNHLLGSHPHSQCPIEIDGQKTNYVKFFSGWGIKTPPGYSCFIYQNFYDINFPIKFFPAIVDTDTYNVTLGMVGYVTTKEKNFELKAGTPLMNIYPFKRDDWKMEIEKNVQTDDQNKFTKKVTQYFKNVYRNFYHSKKRFD